MHNTTDIAFFMADARDGASASTGGLKRQSKSEAYNSKNPASNDAGFCIGSIKKLLITIHVCLERTFFGNTEVL